ncbi:MAG: peptidoglycan DD-metalloendopeptidase family protein [Candidatus Cloacimonadota bacterium]|nr:peptidoglycan DD-metalloendopeptidase family protein [Candidatus Cloacimonadota bacterium]
MKKFYQSFVIITIFSTLFSMSVNPTFITPSKKYHIVKKNETLLQISKITNISERKLIIFNNLENDKIFVGQKIYLIPNINKKNEFITVRNIPKDGYHIVKEGEDIFTVIKMYDLDIVEIIDINDLDDLAVISGEKIFLKSSSTKKSAKSLETNHENPKFHIIRFGDNLTKISKKYNLSISNLKKYNNLKTDIIIAGNKLYLKPNKNLKKKLPSPKHSKSSSKSKVEKKEKINQNLSNLKKVYLPVKGTVTSEFGMRNGRPHKGIDISNKIGTPIHAALDGIVAYTGEQKGYGKVVILKHKNNIMTIYAHNHANLVREKDNVKKGQPIATLGNTGRSTGPHLHFEYRLGGKAIDPRKILPEL